MFVSSFQPQLTVEITISPGCLFLLSIWRFQFYFNERKLLASLTHVEFKLIGRMANSSFTDSLD